MRPHALLTAFALAVLRCAASAAQQTGLTEGQIKAAELEVPELAKLFELKPGMTVADVGAGFGAWTMRFSRVVGPSGRVYATDIGAAQLAALRDAVQREGLDECHRDRRRSGDDEPSRCAAATPS